jgi:cobyrinic acid a,c-diamide synthase
MLNFSIPRIVVSALRGGSGKTILSLSLIALWHKKGIKSIPFKKGPDFIDAGWLAKASGSPCYNLDLFMMSPEQVLQSFISHTCMSTKDPQNPPLPPSFAKGGDTPLNPLLIEGKIPPLKKGDAGGFCKQIAIIEGNRGLFDGVDHKGTYSTAELAKLLKAPVIMIIDCTKATNTIAAMVLGIQKMDTKVSIKGIVLNNIATGRQESLIRKSIWEKCKLPVLGAIPRLKKDPFPERHMGLTPFHEHKEIRKSINTVIEIGEKYLDIESIWKIAKKAVPLSPPSPSRGEGKGGGERSSLKIGVIKDSAFQFYYPENFEELEKLGAKLINISALQAKQLPDIDLLYIGGGFPETHAIALANNTVFKNSLRRAVENGLPVYAECGGLMYLGKSITLKNKSYPMAGVLPITFSLEKKPQAHGYTILEVKKTNPYFTKNSVLKGHEFHYSRVLDIEKHKNLPSPRFDKGGMVMTRRGGFSEQIYMAFKVHRGEGIKDGMDGICYKNVLATYTHLHALGTTEWASGLINRAREFKKSKSKIAD